MGAGLRLVINMKPIVGLALVVTAVSAVAGPQKISLFPKYKLGERDVYSYHMASNSPMMKMTSDMTLTTVVKKVYPDGGADVVSTISNARSTMNGKVQNSSMFGNGKPTTAHVGPHGASLGSENPMAGLMNPMLGKLNGGSLTVGKPMHIKSPIMGMDMDMTMTLVSIKNGIGKIVGVGTVSGGQMPITMHMNQVSYIMTKNSKMVSMEMTMTMKSSQGLSTTRMTMRRKG